MIKVFIQIDKFRGGPAVFRGRLIEQFKHDDSIEVVTDARADFDIELSFIRPIHKHKKPRIARMDGCYYIGSTLPNDALKKNVRKAKYVIYQSSFSRQMCLHFLKVHKPSKVIYNGVDFRWIANIEPDKTIEPNSFVTVSHRWRKNKRPVSTIRGFEEASCGRHLYVVGEAGKDITFPRASSKVHFLGMKAPDETIAIMKACQYQLHLCHVDSCPNAVIEGLACGLNVLCTNLGGTRELVKDNGFVLEVDPWNNKKMPKQDLDTINPLVVAKGIHELLKIQEEPVRPDLEMSVVAEKYAKVIKKVATKHA